MNKLRQILAFYNLCVAGMFVFLMAKDSADYTNGIPHSISTPMNSTAGAITLLLFVAMLLANFYFLYTSQDK